MKYSLYQCTINHGIYIATKHDVILNENVVFGI